MELPDISALQKRVVIVGAGFAGINLAKQLSTKYFQVVLLDRNNYHQFQPLLYQVASSGLEPSSISFPLRKMFEPFRNVFIRVAEVIEVDCVKKIVFTSIGELVYDYLVLAHGAVTNYFNNPGIQAYAYSMKSVAESLLLRNRLLQNYEKALVEENEEERKALLNIVIVGGGPTGVELAGAIAEMRNHVLPKDYSELDFSNMRIYLLEGAARLLGVFPVKLSLKVRRYLENMNVTVMTSSIVEAYDGRNVVLKNGDHLMSRTLIWTAGVKGNVLKGIPPSSLSSNDRIMVNEFCEVKGLPDVFAIGDVAQIQTIAYPKGNPQVAPVAIQQASLLAHNLLNRIEGRPLKPFIYRDKGVMATVGKNKAVVMIGGVKFHGYVAWLLWMFVHLISLIGVKNKLFVLQNWIGHYFTNNSSLRLMITPQKKN